ncbi:thioesterase [bacterium]|nr:thioesterase [bacterium]
MSDIYQITYDVRPYEAGYQKTLQPEALLNYFQDAAFKHSLSRGFSAFHLLKKGLTWVLSRYHIRVERYPTIGEQVHVRTWYPGPQKPFYLRDWEVLDDNGTALAQATSSWLILDVGTMKPVDDNGLLDGLEQRSVRAIEDPFNPLPEFKESHFESRFCVRLGDTDMNRHVNHVHYVQWALESVARHASEGTVPLEIEAGYRAEARSGDTIIAHARDMGGGFFGHRLVLESDGKELTRLRTRWG